MEADPLTTRLNRLETLFHGAGDAIFLIAADGSIVEANARSTELFGYLLDELRGMHSIDLTAPEFRRDTHSRIERLIAGETFPIYRTELLHKTGERIAVEINASCLRDGEEPIVLSVVRDIRDKVRLELKLQQSDRLEALGTLAGGIAHDLNNILASIIGFVELARADLEPTSDTARSLDRALSASDRASKLVSQILSFGRADSGVRKPLELTTVVAETMRLVRATLPANIEIRVESEHRHLVVSADPTQMQQVVLNLCANAGKAMASTGGTLLIEVGTAEIDTAPAHKEPVLGTIAPEVELPAGEYVMLRIRDTGPGVPANIRDRVFEPFFTTRAAGSGLGLSVVAGIVRNHGGSVTLEDTNAGASFCILLPREQKPPELWEPEQKAVGGNGETLLVLDDEVDLTEIMTRTLGELGYRIMSSNDPLDALQLISAWHPEIDLIITDEHMPQMTGSSFVARAREIGAEAPVLVITGVNAPIPRDVRKRLGICSVVHKPVTRERLAAAVHAVLADGR